MRKKEIKLNSTNIYDGKVVKLFVDEVKCPNNIVARREIVKHPGGVCILAFNNGKVILEKQYRYAYNQIIYELPAGKLEKGENPSEAAKREFEEETGYKVKEIESFGCIYPTCGYSNEIIYLFYASKIVKGEKHLDVDENLEVIEMDINDVISAIDSNVIVDAKTICLILKYIQRKNVE